MFSPITFTLHIFLNCVVVLCVRCGIEFGVVFGSDGWYVFGGKFKDRGDF